MKPEKLSNGLRLSYECVASVGWQSDPLVQSQGSSQLLSGMLHAGTLLPACPRGELGTECSQPRQFPQEQQELHEGVLEMPASCLHLRPIIVPTTFNQCVPSTSGIQAEA